IFVGMQCLEDGQERPVAIKRLLTSLQNDPHAEDWLRREADITEGLRHPQLVQTLELARIGGQLCLVMELVEGETLRALLDVLTEQRQVLSPSLSAHLCLEVATGLAHAHEHTDGKGRLRPVIHGDLTPANVLISRSGVVKLADFGIAEVAQGRALPP